MAASQEWFSLYGEIEVMVGRMMVNEGKARPLPLHPGMPHETNAQGKPVRMVISVPRQFLQEFEERIANLRA